jgi:hypothetical protein
MTWHDHPEKDRPKSTDAPPGPALAGAEYWTHGFCGTIAWRGRTTVTAAEPSRRYATESEMIFSHPRAPRVRSTERYLLEDEGESGCLVRFETEVSREEIRLGWFQRAYVAVVDRLVVRRELRRNFQHVLRAAETEAARLAAART